MARSLDAHINDEELEALLRGEGESLGLLQAHLETCVSCARTLDIHKAGQTVLEKAVLSDLPVSGTCPPAETWWEIAAGDLVDCDPMIEHATTCRNCSFHLRAALESREQPEGLDTGFLDNESARHLAQEMAQQWSLREATTPIRPIPLRARLRGKVLIFSSVAAGLILAAGAAFLFRSPSTDQLIAEAYQEHRTIDFRISGADAAPLRMQRGKNDLPVTLPMLNAETAISDALAKNPNSPIALRQSAMIHLLRWEYQAAFPLLQRAESLSPNDSEILETLALAYDERGESENRSDDIQQAVSLLGQILKLTPNSRIALYNRAIAFEHLMMYKQAGADWHHLLELESRGAWADEARRRLSRIPTR